MSWVEIEQFNRTKTLLNLENVECIEEAVNDEEVAYTVLYMKSGKITILPVSYDVLKRRLEECYTKMQVKVYEHDDVASVIFELDSKKKK